MDLALGHLYLEIVTYLDKNQFCLKENDDLQLPQLPIGFDNREITANSGES